MMTSNQFFLLVTSNIVLIGIAAFGGLVLSGYKAVHHFHRPKNDKYPVGRYVAWILSLFVVLPVLGTGMLVIYLANGDKISSILAFQIGLTSPAIVQSMMTVAANKLQNQGVEAEPGQ